MKWINRRHIFDPLDYRLPNGCFEFAQSPQTLVFDDFVRIYFSTRKKEENTGKFLSMIAYLDFDKEFNEVLNVSAETPIKLGDLGCFDEHGIFPINILRHDNKILAYTCGWSRRMSVSVETSTGLAYSNDGGVSFEKYGSGPVLTSSLKEPCLVGDSFVKVYNNLFHMWYIFGQRWLKSTDKEPPARVYKIAHAISKDGITWQKEEGKQIIADVLNADECQALPTVTKIGDLYHMYFCFREATDFRKNHDRGYRLGYAWSDDLKNWTRNDELGGMQKPATGWDAEMMCYPHIFQCYEKVYLLYNGNEFGRRGFGIAELEQGR
ncbi:MAG: hypothetical protein EKK37_14265 [Sphingobacteriales bacterium]|nr:MAG: hypothetical protein EKK37_14265 [Sphingobacteriales bacterium]